MGTFSEEDGAQVAVRFVGVLPHGTEGALLGDAVHLFLCQWEAEELRDLLHFLR